MNRMTKAILNQRMARTHRLDCPEGQVSQISAQ